MSPSRPIFRALVWCGMGLFWAVSVGLGAPAVELAEAQDHFRRGRYEEALAAAESAIEGGRFAEDWPLLQVRSLLALGRYPGAQAALDQAIERHQTSIRLRWAGVEVHRRTGDPRQARVLLEQVSALVSQSPWRYSDAQSVVVAGQVALELGADPREVLEGFLDRARQRDPDCREAYLAVAELALAKHDDAVAAEVLGPAIERFPEDPDLRFAQARALAGSGAGDSQGALRESLELNPRHVSALLFVVDHLVDSECYDQAEARIAEILRIDPWRSEAWAYRAVLANLRGDVRHESACRAVALRHGGQDPSVDHLIGQKLSQKYRFAEGSRYQRQALEYDPDFLPARAQLAQDLLRLGREAEGWKLAAGVFERDAYDVAAFNLMELRDRLEAFTTLREGNFIVRMEAREAAMYGREVLDLLGRAERVLCAKYGYSLAEPITVEIFPRQSDFAVRTFGMPGGAGYLGVCFGKVITANSPAATPEHPANWRAVLWHEFCHVVTLERTGNRIPRWLSEGISVYEERLADPAWGQRMTPQYRERILAGQVHPIAELSGAFLSPQGDLGFAYFESSLAVEFLVEACGLESLVGILRDLGAGMGINEAITRNTGRPLEWIEKEFSSFLRARAQAMGPGADWTREGLPTGTKLTKALTETLTEMDWTGWLDEHPTGIWGLLGYAQHLTEGQKWEAAREPLELLIALCPEFTGTGNPYELLAGVHRRLGNMNEERMVLEELARRADDARDCYRRLLELEAAAGDWRSAGRTADRLLAVAPQLPEVHWHRGRAFEEAGKLDDAVRAYQTLLLLDPPDPVEVHYRIARLLAPTDPQAARRHVLAALESAPRFRPAHRLLLDLHERETEPGQAEGR